MYYSTYCLKEYPRDERITPELEEEVKALLITGTSGSGPRLEARDISVMELDTNGDVVVFVYPPKTSDTKGYDAFRAKLWAIQGVTVTGKEYGGIKYCVKVRIPPQNGQEVQADPAPAGAQAPDLSQTPPPAVDEVAHGTGTAVENALQ